MNVIRKHQRKLAITMLAAFAAEIFYPTASFAITGHNSMPEYRSFEPVATTNMVNMFDGSFTYNIPLLDIPNGYPINLAYHSGEITTEAQASWVGLGWTLNPGAINRMKRGAPDDFKDVPVTYHHRMPLNWTVSAAAGGNFELLGKEKSLSGLLSAGLEASVRFNNYNGVGYSVHAPLQIAGGVNLDFSYSQGRFGFNAELSSMGFINAYKKNKSARKDKTTKEQMLKSSYFEEMDKAIKSGDFDDLKKKTVNNYLAKTSKRSTSNQVSFSSGNGGFSLGSFFGTLSLPSQSFPTTNSPYTGLNIHLKFAVGVNGLPIPMDVEGEVSGGVNFTDYDKTSNKKVFGYMHNESASGLKENVMDYTTENDSPYEKRDNILGIPMPNNDVYSLSGEALGGSFRAFRSEFGKYRPDYTQSKSYSLNLDGDVNIPSGTSIFPIVGNGEASAGGEVGGAYSTSTVKDWEDSGSDHLAFGGGDENWFFRFSNDMGGSFDLANNDFPYSPSLSGAINAKTDLSASYGGGLRDYSTRSNRSSYIRPTFQADVAATSKDVRYKLCEKNLHFYNPISDQAEAYQHNYVGSSNDPIVELSTYNADGVHYVYGLPVYTRNEKQLSYSLRKDQDYTLDASGLIATLNGSPDIEGQADRKNGYECSTPYATTYLLTHIANPDYVDRHMDGPTPDDFGSYTKFNYKRYAGGAGATGWYPYRSPYTGLDFSVGSLSDRRDDMGSLSFGEKELYYIQTIASKTHVAVFSTSQRQDGQGAKVNNTSDINNIIKGEGGITPQPLQKLDRIDLYAMADMEEIMNGSLHTGIYQPKSGAAPIKTVRFEYTYELCGNLPNNSTGGGKLTLSKVWFEYEGKLTSKLSPYVFKYQYEDNNSYPTPYSALESYGVTSNQNVNYSPINTDRWGNYRDFSDMQTKLGNLAKFFPFVNQDPAPEFDPAMWCLKRIQLPSGGEIHVQYEQNDYHFVQNQVASVMVPLSASTPDGEDMNDVTNKKYYLDLSKIGIDFNQVVNKHALVDQLFAAIRDKKERIFFSFLYRLIDQNASPDPNDGSSDYLEGYARIDRYGYDVDPDDITKVLPYFTFKREGNDSPIYAVDVNYDSKTSKRELPRKVCSDFYKTQRRGLLNNVSGELAKAVKARDGEKIGNAFLNLIEGAVTPYVCQKMKPEMSYVRVQMPFSKRKEISPGEWETVCSPKLGGGVRVKRLLMYSPEMTNGVSSLYGNEYEYRTTLDGTPAGIEISSGVASNEPTTGRRENSLVKPIDKDRQAWYEAILFGRDMYGQEGPLGESLMPGASIGYSKITVKNIHQGKTSTGKEEHEFYTYRDFPFLALRNQIKESFLPKLGAGVGIPGGSVGINISYKREAPHLTQGYSFINYGMHGQKKRSAKFAKDNTQPLAEEIYEYFKANDQVGMMDESMNVSDVTFKEQFGKESEILAERREVADYAYSGSLGADITGGPVVVQFGTLPITFPLPYKTKVRVGASVDEKIIRTLVTSKIINYPAVVKKIININDGVRNISENLVLDKFTGTPVVVRTYDDFNSYYLNHDYMAFYSHANMRSKARNEKLTLTQQINLASGTFDGVQRKYLDFGTISDPCTALAQFIKGDLLNLKTQNAFGLYHVEEVNISEQKVFVINSGLDEGNISTGQAVTVYIENSGYTNQLNAKQGNIMTHGKGIQPISVGVSGSYSQDLANQTAFIEALNQTWRQFGTTTFPGTTYLTSKTNSQINCDLSIENLTVTVGIGEGSFICAADYYHTSIDDIGVVIETGVPYYNDYSYFSIDNSGNLIFHGINEHNILDTTDYFSCLQFCNTVCSVPPSTPSVENVVSASAMQYADDWEYDNNKYPFDIAYNQFSGNNPNKFESAKLGKWRPHRQYVYRENINQADIQPTEYRNWNEGKFEMTFFDWTDTDPFDGNGNDANKWVLTSTTNKYTPNGEAQEDENILGIKSTAKFGYNHTLPVCVAQNASDNSVIYESFENLYTNELGTLVFEESLPYNSSTGTLISTLGHTGKQSIKLLPNQDFDIGTIDVASSSSAKEGLLTRVWLYTGKNQAPPQEEEIALLLSGSGFTGFFPIKNFTLVSRAGKWSLYEAHIPKNEIGEGQITLQVRSYIPGVYMDDVRVQPLESEMVCYVYDKAQRLAAVLDDQHYAMVYEYNSEGVLVRKLKETVNGIKTVSETQYNSKGELRNP